ncbi:hypothetical protein NNJEOMEG_02153 [Fundidesulfovibrio magnetotacticus]|uniref:Uncharacterized protein n=1 Tax=Fundidesulfovibrio magnetotacticus TaxID=2730080 RepID=A0A6V8LUQ5_9BACT|nr:DUF6785 family protein [Fundidesulfovibrio magnetotacticus]GFK94311.1 hypothetical protein NNJEOMEG_02153 [Fundidesulfovibrio magnetotacticus]
MKQSVIRPRAVVLGVLSGALLCLATPYNNMYLAATPLGGGHFPLAPFILLVCLTILTALVARIFKTAPLFNGAELLGSWMLAVLMSGIAYTGLMRTLLINLTAVDHFASAGNRWNETLAPLLPQAWTLTDHNAVELLYNGLPDGRRLGWLELLQRIPWSAWAGPMAAWGVFIGLTCVVMVCIVNLFSRQWIVNERMNFPLLRLPYLMEESFQEGRVGAFFTNGFLLTGLMIPVVLHTVNGLSTYMPSVPQIPTVLLAGPYFPRTGLFMGFSKLKIYLIPAFVGFAFLTSRQISLSFWVFFVLGGLLTGALALVGLHTPPSALGVTFGPTLTLVEETQMIGAYGVFFLFVVWLARDHLLEVVRTAFGKGESRPRESEWFSTRLAFWGLVAGGAGLMAWCAAFGMPLGATVLLLGIFFVVMVVASRVICQGGIAYFTLTAAPSDGLLAFFGSGFFSQAGLLMGVMLQKIQFLDLRESLMPSLVHAAKVGEPVARKRLYFAGICLAIGLGVVVSFTAMLALCHKVGVRDLQAEWEISSVLRVYEDAQRLLEAPSGFNPWVISYAGAGAVVMLGLILCFQRFYWWPLHPVGYLTMYSSSMRILWFSFFVGWLCNHAALRYGGVEFFAKARMLFIGLILGDFLMGGVFAVAGLFLGQSYQVLPS